MNDHPLFPQFQKRIEGMACSPSMTRLLWQFFLAGAEARELHDVDNPLVRYFCPACRDGTLVDNLGGERFYCRKCGNTFGVSPLPAIPTVWGNV